MKCPNKNLKEWKELEANSPNLAYKIWNDNNGNSIDRAANGRPSILFNDIMSNNEMNRNVAIQEKSNIYTEQFKNFSEQNAVSRDENGEPTYGALTNYLTVTSNNASVGSETSSHQITNYSKPDAELNKKIEDWLGSVGISYKKISNILDNEGNPINAVARANILQGLIEVVEGKEDATTLPEEASHFLVEMIRDTPLYSRLKATAMKSDMYATVYSEYGDTYGNNDEKIADETIAKLIAEEIINEGVNISAEDKGVINSLKKLFNRAIDYLRNLFDGKIKSDDINVFKEAANIILNNRTNNLKSLKDIQNSTPSRQYYYQLNQDALDRKNALLKALADQKITYDVINSQYRRADGKPVKYRASDIVKNYYRKLFRNEFKESENTSKIYAKKGTLIHKTMEVLMNMKIQGKQLKNLTYDQIRGGIEYELGSLEDFRGEPSSFYNISAEQFYELKEGIEDIYNNIQKNQSIINDQLGWNNNSPENQAVIITEQILYDEKNDKAGTADLLVVYPNGTVGIYDYKSVNFKTIKKNGKYQVIQGIPGYKEEAFNIQLLEYKTILANQYGVSDFAETRIVPLNMQFKRNKKGDILSDGFRTLEIGYKNNEDRFYLEQVPVAQELTAYEKLNKELQKLFSLQSKLKKQLKLTPKDNSLRIQYNRISNIIKKLQLYNNLEVVYREINSIHKEFNERKSIPYDKDNDNNGFLTYEDLNRMLESLKTLSDFADNTQPILVEQTKGQANQREIVSNFERLDYQVARLTEQIHEKLTDYLNKNEDFDVLSDVQKMSWLGRNFKTIHEINGGIFRKASKLIRRNEDIVRQRTDKFVKDIEKLHNGVKSWADRNGKTLQEAFDMLVNRDTGELASRYSKELFDDKEKAINNGDTSFFTSTFMIKKNGKKFQYTGGALEAFERSKKNLQDRLERDLYGDDRADERKKQLNDWLYRYDVSINSNAMFNRNNYFIKIDPEKANRYESERFKNIAASDELYSYYRFLLKSNREFNSITNRDLKSTFIPNFRLGVLESLSENGLTGITTLHKSLLESMAIQEEDTVVTSEKINPLTQKPELTVPLLGVNRLVETLTNEEYNEVVNSLPETLVKNTKEYDEELNRRLYNKKVQKGLETKSYDLTRSMILFAKMAYNYEQLKSTEAQILGLRELARNKNINTVLTTKTGKLMNDKYSKQIAKFIGMPEADIELFDKFVNHYWYGVTVENDTAAFTYGEVVDDDGKVVEKGKTISGNRLAAKILQYTALTQLGFKPLIAAYNAIQQQLNYYIIGVESQYFDLASAKKTMDLSINEAPKYNALVELFMTYSSDQLSKKANQLSASNVTKHLSIDKAFVWLEQGDKFADRQILASMLNYWGIDSNGKIRRLDKINSADKKSLWELAKYDQETDSVSIEGLSPEEFTRFRSLAIQAGTAVKGILPNSDVIAMNTSIAGKFIMQYRNWIPGMIKSRFGGLKYDALTDEHDIRRFSALFNEIGKGNQNTALKFGRLLFNSIPILHYLSGNYNQFDISAAKRLYDEYKDNTGDQTIQFDEFINTYQNRLKAAAFEFRTVTSLLLVALLAQGLAKAVPDVDDDDYVGKGLNWAAMTNYRIWNRAFHEAAFFINPGSVMELIKSPIASFGIIETVYKWAPNTVDEIRDFLAGDDYKGVFNWEEDPNDRTPPLKYTTRLLPFANAVQDFFDIYNTVTLN